MLELLKTINRLYGITLVIVTHEMAVVKTCCHRVAVMEQGKILETTALAQVFDQKNSLTRSMLYAQLSPQLPACLSKRVGPVENSQPLLSLLFQGEEATVPFISQCSRDLRLDINILLANIDRFDGITCGIVVVELSAGPKLLQTFLQRCAEADITVEVLGYVHDDAV